VKDDDDDLEDWDEDVPEEPDESGVVECPACGADVYEDSPRCPVCGEYLLPGSRSGSALAGKPVWYVGLAIAGIVAVILTLCCGAMLWR